MRFAGRERRWDRLDWQREHTGHGRQRSCRFRGIRPVVSARWSEANGSGLAGVAVCGLRSCAGCGPKIATRRRLEFEALLGWGQASGFDLVMVTLTVPHHAGERLAALFDRLLGVWRTFGRARAWQEARSEFGVEHFIRVVECKHGRRNGWHPHMHLVLFSRAAAPAPDFLPQPLAIPGPQFASQRSPQAVAAARASGLGEAVWAAWKAAAAARGVAVDRGAFDAHLVVGSDLDGLSGYFAKEHGDETPEDMAWELAGQETKTSGESRTPFGLLDLARGGDEEAERLWLEYEAALVGTRSVSYSRGLTAAAALVEQTDEEAARDAVEDPERVVSFMRQSWHRFARPAGRRGDLFARLRVSSPEEVVEWIAGLGIVAWEGAGDD